MSNLAQAIRIGTMINAPARTTAERIVELRDLGFESFEPFCGVCRLDRCRKAGTTQSIATRWR